MVHNFKRFPELTNSQMELYYWESPHKQIFEDFRAEVTKVHDGDTITVRTNFRDFDFQVRFAGTNAPELSEEGGNESRDWLNNKIMGRDIDILVNPENRVGKFGRLIGIVVSGGVNLNEESIRSGRSTTFENRNEGKLPNLNKELNIEKWL